jgi:hypothetical protein
MPVDSAVGEPHRGAHLAHGRNEVGMARPVKNERSDVVGPDGFRLGERADVLLSGRIEINDPFVIAGTDGDLCHVNVGRVEQGAPLRHGHGGDRSRHILGA